MKNEPAKTAGTEPPALPTFVSTFFVLLKLMLLNLIAPTIFTAKSQKVGISRYCVCLTLKYVSETKPC